MQTEFFPGYSAAEATEYARPILAVKMIYLIVVKLSPTWYVTRTIRAKRLILKSELRRVASDFYNVPQLNVTVI